MTKMKTPVELYLSQHSQGFGTTALLSKAIDHALANYDQHTSVLAVLLDHAIEKGRHELAELICSKGDYVLTVGMKQEMAEFHLSRGNTVLSKVATRKMRMENFTPWCRSLIKRKPKWLPKKSREFLERWLKEVLTGEVLA